MRDLYMRICEALNAAGHEAYLVGGCVRDTIMAFGDFRNIDKSLASALMQEAADAGFPNAKDIDIATDATPEQAAAAITLAAGHDEIALDQVGKAFGVLIASANGQSVEIATFRSDSSGRKPSVEFVRSLALDAARRDFRMNAMYYDPIAKHFADPTDGLSDICWATLRTPGDPMESFSADVLRVLRAIRFSARFDLTIPREMKKAIEENSSLVGPVTTETRGRIPQDRVVKEFLSGLRQAKDPLRYMSALFEHGLADSMFGAALAVELVRVHVVGEECELLAEIVTSGAEGCTIKYGEHPLNPAERDKIEKFVLAVSFGLSDNGGLPNWVTDISKAGNSISEYLFSEIEFDDKRLRKSVNALGDAFPMLCAFLTNVRLRSLENAYVTKARAFQEYVSLPPIKASDVMRKHSLSPGPEVGVAVSNEAKELFLQIINKLENEKRDSDRQS